MNGYEKIVTMMQKAASKNGDINSPFILGEMTDAKTCDIGDIVLDEDDLLVNAELKDNLAAGDTVLINRLDEDDFIILCKVEEI